MQPLSAGKDVGGQRRAADKDVGVVRVAGAVKLRDRLAAQAEQVLAVKRESVGRGGAWQLDGHDVSDPLATRAPSAS